METNSTTKMNEIEATHPGTGSVEETIKWLEGLREENWKKPKGERVLSPSTKSYIDSLGGINGRLTISRKELIGSEADPMRQRLLESVRQGVSLRLENDEKYHKQRLKLEALKKDAWYLRYGYYFAFKPDTLGPRFAALDQAAKKAAKDVARNTAAAQDPGRLVSDDTPSNEEAMLQIFLRDPWIAIHNRLQTEQAERDRPRGADDPAPATPMLDLVSKLDGMISESPTDLSSTLSSIELYAPYPQVAHSNIEQLIQEGSLYRAAERWFDDFLAVRPEGLITYEEWGMARECVMACLGRYFERLQVELWEVVNCKSLANPAPVKTISPADLARLPLRHDLIIFDDEAIILPEDEDKA